MGADKITWNSSKADVDPGMAYALAGARMKNNMTKPLHALLADYQKTDDLNAASQKEANTGAFIEQIRAGKTPDKTGMYDASAVSNAQFDYDKYQQELVFKRAQEGRLDARLAMAKAAAGRQASTYNDGKLLNQKLNALDAQLLNAGDTNTAETVQNTVVPEPAVVQPTDDSALAQGIMNNYLKQTSVPDEVNNAIEVAAYTPPASEPALKTVEDYLSADDGLAEANAGSFGGNGRILYNKSPAPSTKVELFSAMDATREMNNYPDDLVTQIMNNRNAPSADFTNKPHNSFLLDGNAETVGPNMTSNIFPDAGVENLDSKGKTASMMDRTNYPEVVETTPEERTAMGVEALNQAKQKESLYNDYMYKPGESLSKMIKDTSTMVGSDNIVKTPEGTPEADLAVANKNTNKQTGVVQNEDGSIEKISLNPQQQVDYDQSVAKVKNNIGTINNQLGILKEKSKILNTAGKSTRPIVNQMLKLKDDKKILESQLTTLKGSKAATIQSNKASALLKSQLSAFSEKRNTRLKKADKLSPLKKDIEKQKIATETRDYMTSYLNSMENVEIQKVERNTTAGEMRAKSISRIKDKYNNLRKEEDTKLKRATTLTPLEQEIKDAAKKKIDNKIAVNQSIAEAIALGKGEMKKVAGKADKFVPFDKKKDGTYDSKYFDATNFTIKDGLEDRKTDIDPDDIAAFNRLGAAAQAGGVPKTTFRNYMYSEAINKDTFSQDEANKPGGWNRFPWPTNSGDYDKIEANFKVWLKKAHPAAYEKYIGIHQKDKITGAIDRNSTPVAPSTYFTKG